MKEAVSDSNRLNGNKLNGNSLNNNKLLENIDFKELTKDLKTQEDLSVLTKEFMKNMIENMLKAEMDEFIENNKNNKNNKNKTIEENEENKSIKNKAIENTDSHTSKNGYYPKKVRSHSGELNLNIPRDRKAEFEPMIVKKGQRTISGIDDKIISMYARGMSLRDIEKQVKDMYDVEMSDTLLSRIIDRIIPEIREWQNRTLDSIYSIVYMDAMVFKIKNDNGFYRNKSLHFAIGINLEGKKDLLGMWITDNEGSRFWLSIVTELKNRGVRDILIASVDGLKGFSEAINSVFPKTIVQRCIIHQIRYSMKYVGSKYKKEFMVDLKKVYKAPTKNSAEDALLELEDKWGKKYPIVINSWKKNWDELSTYFEYTEPIRRIIYTTNTIEGFNRQIRKITKTKGGFNNDDSLFKLVYLIYKDISKKWKKSIPHWAEIISQFAIIFKERLDPYLMRPTLTNTKMD